MDASHSRIPLCYGTSEITLAKAVLGRLQPGVLCLADRYFFGFELWNEARATGADLLWRIKKNVRLACEERLPDGSYLSRIYACEKDRRHKTNGVEVRVVDYRLEGVADAEPIYRLVTSILDHDQAPADEGEQQKFRSVKILTSLSCVNQQNHSS